MCIKCNPFTRNILRVAGRGLWPFWSDERYLQELWKFHIGTELNLTTPVSFNEKLQWLKLHDRKPQYVIMADKYKVRRYIAERIGKEYLIPLLGVWKRPEEIDFRSLPSQFVLKCNHNSGLGMCICKDKSKINEKKVIKGLKKGLRDNYFYHGREWPYKDIPRRIIGEKFMVDSRDEDGRGLIDYKFYCFNGEPKFLYVSQGLDVHETARIRFLTLDWEFAPYARCDYKEYETLPPKPAGYEKMLEIARILSAETIFLRVDLYEINGQIYFSELTFYPGAGFTIYKHDTVDMEIGSLLKLPIQQ